MSHEFPHHAVACFGHSGLNGMADVPQPCPAPRGRNARVQCRLGSFQQKSTGRSDSAQGHGRGCIPYPSIKNDAHIQFHHVTISKPPWTADSMNHLFVDRNAELSGKFPIPQKSTACPIIPDQGTGNLIDFPGGSPRFQAGTEFLEDFSGKPAACPHAGDPCRVLDGNRRHGPDGP